MADLVTRLRPRTIRARTTAVATLGVLAVLAVVSVALVIGQRLLLSEALDETLERRAADVIAAWTDEAGADLAGDDDVGWQVVGPGGEPLGASSLLRDAGVIWEPTMRSRLRTFEEVPGLEAFGEEVRVLSVGFDSGGPRTVHVIGAREDLGEATVALAVGLGVAVPVSTAVLGWLVWVAVGRTLRPVETVRSEVESIGPTDLHRRVPEPDTGDEIARLAGTMNDMLGRIETSVEAQRRFVADASHELRSPLTRIRTDLEVAPAGQPVGDLRDDLIDDVDGLADLVDGLLYLARSDAGAGLRSRELLDLDDLTRVEVQHARDRAARRDVGPVSVEIDLEPVEVRGDAAALGRVIRNLLDNAIRHARSEVAVHVRAQGALATVTVDDDGIGIPESERDRVFERFTRLDDARSRDAGGSGLGLAIARDVARQHGGDLVVSSSSIGGARLRLTLPSISAR